MNTESYGVFGMSADYVNYDNCAKGISGANVLTYDTSANGLLYPLRLEEGSSLSVSGSDGGVVGPFIVKKIGRSGTLYGEEGWDEETDEALWPFPNEDKIKELMSETVDGVSGEYGFCTGTSIDGTQQTLTKYIWEYLGNQIPDDVYGNVSDVTTGCDLNGDNQVNIQDVIICVNVFLGAADGNADVNGDGQVNVQDVIAIVNKILRGE